MGQCCFVTSFKTKWKCETCLAFNDNKGVMLLVKSCARSGSGGGDGGGTASTDSTTATSTATTTSAISQWFSFSFEWCGTIIYNNSRVGGRFLLSTGACYSNTGPRRQIAAGTMEGDFSTGAAYGGAYCFCRNEYGDVDRNAPVTTEGSPLVRHQLFLQKRVRRRHSSAPDSHDAGRICRWRTLQRRYLLLLLPL
jgi:hypothetical protein